MSRKPVDPIASMVSSALQQYEMSDEKLELVFGFIRTSREDLSATGILYENKLFASSTYHLQQAVEKASKAFGLFTGLFSIEEMREVRHDSIRVHNMMANKMQRSLVELSRKYPMIRSNFESLGQLTSKKKRMEIARLPNEEIQKMIAVYDLWTSGIKEDWELDLDKIVKLLQDEFPKDEIDAVMPEATKLVSRLSKHYPAMAQFSKSIPFLFIASAITFPHVTFTRYPDKEIKPWEYNESMGIVAATPSIVERLDRALLSLESLTGKQTEHDKT